MAADFSATPPDVVITREAPEPITDPTLGTPVALAAAALEPKHRLVALGDSLTMGFQSFAIFNTAISYPALIARELGSFDAFRFPTFPEFDGLPLNLEYVVRRLQEWFGPSVSLVELPLAAFRLGHLAERVSEYWETGIGSRYPNDGVRMHNLAVAGYDVGDLTSRTADSELLRSQTVPRVPLNLIAANSGPLMGLYVLNTARGPRGEALTPAGAATALGQDGGIETLIVNIGANNALGAMTSLKVWWTQDNGEYRDLAAKAQYTVWNPRHFAEQMDTLMAQVDAVNARHVIWATVPHVTIVPLAHGVDNKMGPGSRYYPFYSRPWLPSHKFNPDVHPHVTGDQARAIDSAIDQYNQTIVAGVKRRREAGKDWLLLDQCGLMDRLAARRYAMDPAARPAWWTPYEMPPALAALHPVPDSLFFAAGPRGRTGGGLFALDGVHPTTIAYGLMAQEFIRVMELAGVVFKGANGEPRQGPIEIDFAQLLALDTLMSDPPAAITPDMALVGWANDLFDWASWLRKLIA